MKPVQLSQLMSLGQTTSISIIFQSEEHETLSEFLDEHIQNAIEHEVCSRHQLKMKEILSNHPEQSIAFYLSLDFCGYYILNDYFRSLYFVDEKFFIRPIVESLLLNPEFFLINVSLYDIKVYRGEREGLDLTHHFEFEKISQESLKFKARFFTPEFMGVIPFKTMLAVKELAHKLSEQLGYSQFPVIVTGLEEIRNLFLQNFSYSGPLIDHLHEDFYEKSSLEIHAILSDLRHLLVDKYSTVLKERVKTYQRNQKLLTKKHEILDLMKANQVSQIIIPTLKRTSEESREDLSDINDLLFYLIKTEGKVEVLSHHFFPRNITVMGVKRGLSGNLSLLKLSS